MLTFSRLGTLILLLLALMSACVTTPTAVAPSHAASTTLERHDLDADGHAVVLWGKKPQQPRAAILLIHGRTWSALPDFDLQVEGEELSLMELFVARGYATYAIDLRGYGATARDDSGWCSPHRSAADVALALRSIPKLSGVAGPPTLLGWSMGSVVAQHCAQRTPELLSKLVLYGYPLDPGAEFPPHDAGSTPARKQNTAQGAASDFITVGSITERAIAAYVAACLAADPIFVDWTHLDQFNELDPAQVKMPTLLVQGVFDPFLDAQSISLTFNGLGTQDRQWIVIPGADHAVSLERPKLFVETVLGFLDLPRTAETADH